MKSIKRSFIMTILTSGLVLFAATGALAGASEKALPELKTVAHVDLEQYIGKWYEIATIPRNFEKVCAGRATAEYNILPNGSVRVLNSCDKANGKRKVAEGRALVTDSNSNAKLKVSFLHFANRWFFSLLGLKVSGDYWIVELGPDYSYSIVGHPSRGYAWILSRTPALDTATLKHIDGVLRSQGYDTCKLMTTIQDGGLSERKRLCDVVN